MLPALQHKKEYPVFILPLIAQGIARLLCEGRKILGSPRICGDDP